MSVREAPAPSRRGRIWPPLLVAGLFLVVVAAAAWQGSPAFEPRFAWDAGEAPVEVPTSVVSPSGAPAPEPEPVPEIEIDPGPDPTLGAITAFVAAILAMLVILALMRGLRSLRARARATAADVDLHAAVAGSPEGQLDAPVVREGIEDALARLAAPGRARDAIVAAWVELERSAAAAGLVRGAAETQAEFAARVLARTGAGDATRALLRIYEGVRYGARAPRDDDVAAARRHLEEIREAWR